MEQAAQESRMRSIISPKRDEWGTVGDDEFGTGWGGLEDVEESEREREEEERVKEEERMRRQFSRPGTEGRSVGLVPTGDGRVEAYGSDGGGLGVVAQEVGMDDIRMDHVDTGLEEDHAGNDQDRLTQDSRLKTNPKSDRNPNPKSDRNPNPKPAPNPNPPQP